MFAKGVAMQSVLDLGIHNSIDLGSNMGRHLFLGLPQGVISCFVGFTQDANFAPFKGRREQREGPSRYEYKFGFKAYVQGLAYFRHDVREEEVESFPHELSKAFENAT